MSGSRGKIIIRGVVKLTLKMYVFKLTVVMVKFPFSEIKMKISEKECRLEGEYYIVFSDTSIH